MDNDRKFKLIKNCLIRIFPKMETKMVLIIFHLILFHLFVIFLYFILMYVLMYIGDCKLKCGIIYTHIINSVISLFTFVRQGSKVLFLLTLICFPFLFYGNF